MLIKESVDKSTDFIPDGMTAFERNVKRIGDCLLAFIALVVFSPLFLICYIAVRREDGHNCSILKSLISDVNNLSLQISALLI